MRKSDFERIAAALADARHATIPLDAAEQSAHAEVFDSLCRAVAEVLARQSGRFNRVRFLHACGASEKKIENPLQPTSIVIL